MMNRSFKTAKSLDNVIGQEDELRRLFSSSPDPDTLPNAIMITPTTTPCDMLEFVIGRLEDDQARRLYSALGEAGKGDNIQQRHNTRELRNATDFNTKLLDLANITSTTLYEDFCVTFNAEYRPWLNADVNEFTPGLGNAAAQARVAVEMAEKRLSTIADAQRVYDKVLLDITSHGQDLKNAVVRIK